VTLASLVRTVGSAVPAATPSVWLCIVANLLLRLGNSMTGVVMSLVLATMSRGDEDVRAYAVGALAASFYVTELVGAPIFGALSDRFGRWRFMVAGPVCGGIAIQLIGWPSLVLAWPLLLAPMIIGRMIEGLSTAVTAPSVLSYLSLHTRANAVNRAAVMAWYEMATVLGIGGGFVVGGLLWDRLGHGTFAVGTLIYLLSLVLFLRTRDAPAMTAQGEQIAPVASAEPPGLGLLTVVRRPRVLRFLPAWLCVNTVVGVWFTHSAFQLAGERHGNQYLAGGFTGTGLSGAFALFGLAFMLGIYLWGMWIGARSKTNVMLVTLMGLYGVCAALFAINWLGHAGGGLLTLLVGFFLISIGVASGFTPAALAYLADISEEMPEQRGAVMGLYSVMLGLGQLAGSALGSPFAELWGVDGLILLTAILVTGSLLTVLGLRHYEGRAGGKMSAP
jgi:MFS family permease